MEELARVDKHLHELGELSSLVRALRSMAASRAREARDASRSTARYAGLIERAILAIMPFTPAFAPEAQASDGTAFLVAITSESGFVGALNHHVLDKANDALTSTERLLVVGRRGQSVAAERGLDVDAGFRVASRPNGVTHVAREIVKRLGTTRSVRLLFARPTSGARYTLELQQAVPLAVDRRTDESRLAAPLHHLPAEELLHGLLSEYLFAKVADALMEGLASENAARLSTMDSASRNIRDRVERLQRQAVAARQERTTSDLLEVVVGAQAVAQERAVQAG